MNPPVVPGVELDGEPMGAGATASVYRGTVDGSGQRVAVKIASRATTSKPSARKAFINEGEVLRGLYSSQIIDVLDVGFTADGLPYLVMELADRSLEQVLADWSSSSSTPLAARWDLVQRCAHAVEAVHLHGHIHCDIKPANMLCFEEGDWVERVALADFGMVRRRERSESGSQTRRRGGSAGYAAPEQFGLDDEVSTRADVYALAVVAYEVFTGRRGFDAESESGRLAGKIGLPTVAGSGCPPAIDLVLRRAIDSRPENRQAGARVLLDELEAVMPRADKDPVAVGRQQVRGPASPTEVLPDIDLGATRVLALFGELWRGMQELSILSDEQWGKLIPAFDDIPGARELFDRVFTNDGALESFVATVVAQLVHRSVFIESAPVPLQALLVGVGLDVSDGRLHCVEGEDHRAVGVGAFMLGLRRDLDVDYSSTRTFWIDRSAARAATAWWIVAATRAERSWPLARFAVHRTTAPPGKVNEPGWYPDPLAVSQTRRLWNGVWADDTLPTGGRTLEWSPQYDRYGSVIVDR